MEDKTRAVYLADLDYFQSKSENDPNEDYYVQMAFLYFRLGKYDEAISVCTKGLEKHRAYVHLQIILAEAYITAGRKDEAREILFDVVMVDEDNYKALKMLGFVFKSDGDHENALKYLRAAYLKASEDDELLIWLEELGGLETYVDTSSEKNTISGEEELFSDHDEFHFNVDDMLKSGELAMSELMRDISSYRQAGKTLDDMFSGQSAGENEQPVLSAGTAGELKGDELSDEEILKALAKAPAVEEVKETESFPPIELLPPQSPFSPTPLEQPAVPDQRQHPAQEMTLSEPSSLPPEVPVPGSSESADDGTDILSVLKEATVAHVKPPSVAMPDDLPFDLNDSDDSDFEDSGEEESFDEAVKLFQNVSEEEKESAESAAFIPEDLVEAVFREAGISMEDMQDAEPLSDDFMKGGKDGVADRKDNKKADK